MRDPHRDTNNDLAEVRTVLGRTESALQSMGNRWHGDDPDHHEMVQILEEFAEKLSKWRRTGRPLKEKKK